jgi:hypothetical protein
MAEARSAANLVDFSYRFCRLRSNDKRKGGITMAQSILCNSTSYKYTGGLSTLKTRWRDYREAAGFLYLLLVQKFDLMPPETEQLAFSETLLTQVNDTDHLIEFFRAYRHLCEVLKKRGLEFPSIQDFDELPSSELVVEPFQSDVQKAIDGYKSA